MKKYMIKVAFVAAVAMVSGVSFMNSQKSETLSEVALANVEALAAAEVDGVCETYCYQCDGWMCGRITNDGTTRCMNHRKKPQ